MKIVTLDGVALEILLDIVKEAAADTFPIHTLRVASDVDGVKFKLNELTWSPPYRKSPEQVARDLAEHQHDGPFCDYEGCDRV